MVAVKSKTKAKAKAAKLPKLDLRQLGLRCYASMIADLAKDHLLSPPALSDEAIGHLELMGHASVGLVIDRNYAMPQIEVTIQDGRMGVVRARYRYSQTDDRLKRCG